MRPPSLLVVVVVVLVPSLLPRPSAAQEELIRESFSGEIDPSDVLVFRIVPDPVNPVLEVIPPHEAELEDEVAEVLELLPGWLAQDFRAHLRLRPLGEQVRLARFILELEDEDLLDEVVFAVSHVAPEAYQFSDMTLLTRNAELIYDTVDELDYVEIVEHEGPEAYTTLAYTFLVDGSPETWELSRDDYYWYVVHPSFDVEQMAPVHPPTGRRRNDGFFWREYYLSDAEEPERSHRLHWSLRQPDALTDDLLNGASWTTAPAHGSFVDFEIGPIELIRASDTNAPVAVTYVRGDGRCCNSSWPNPDGQLYATMMPLEQIAADHPEPLRNLLDAGTDNSELLPTTLVNASWGIYDEEPRGVLIVRDRLPFDLDEDPNETLLNELGRTPTIVDSATFAEMTIVTDEDPHVVVDHNKIVIPSDQPRALYEVLVARTEDIERFVDYGGVFELHGATRPEDDWSDLRLPGGLYSTEQIADDYVSSVEIAGFPDLLESLRDVEFVWDGVSYPGLSGDRLLEPAEGALSVVGWFVTQNMTTNVSEHAFWTRNPSPPRLQQPVRLLWQHYGNCGELQDVLGAAGRAALLPVWLVSSIADDHVWNEFAAWDTLHPYQVDWSDGPTRIDHWGVAADGDTGGGKTVSGMVGWRGDGWLVNLLGRYDIEEDEEGRIIGDYTRYATIVIRVTDDAGRPVDGALVVVNTNSFYNPIETTAAGWTFTDHTGTASINVGEDNNYWYRVRSTVGHYPLAAEGDPDPFDLDDRANQPVARASDVVPGAVIEEDVQLLGSIEAPVPDSVDPPGVQGAEGVRVVVDLEAGRAVMMGRSPYQLWRFNRVMEQGSIDLFVVDEDNLDAMRSGEAFDAYLIVEDADSGEYEIELPSGDDHYVVVSNARRLATTQEVGVEVVLHSLPDEGGDGGPDGGPDSGPDGGPDGDVDGGGDDGGCDCTVAGRQGSSSLLRGLFGAF